MRAIGYVLITLGFLAGAYLSVVRAEGVPVGAYLIALVVGAAGVVAVQLATRRAAQHVDRLAADMEALEASLARVAENVDRLDEEKESIDVYDLKDRIDDTFPPDLDAFVQARESIIHRHGLQAYADVMNPFAAGERYLNRVWSTSTDGYIDEAHEYLHRAREQFDDALAILRRYDGGEAGSGADAGGSTELGATVRPAGPAGAETPLTERGPEGGSTGEGGR